jgi:hypothetical protein
LLKTFSGNPEHEEEAKLLSIVRFRDNGEDVTIEMEPIIGRASLTIPSFSVSGYGQVGSGNSSKIGENLFTVLSLDSEALEIAKLINSSGSKHFDFWKAKELMVGKTGDLFNQGYLSKSENEEFKKWSNSPEASGVHARHAIADSKQAKVNNISIETARVYMLKAFRNWLNRKYNQSIM